MFAGRVRVAVLLGPTPDLVELFSQNTPQLSRGAEEFARRASRGLLKFIQAFLLYTALPTVLGWLLITEMFIPLVRPLVGIHGEWLTSKGRTFAPVMLLALVLGVAYLIMHLLRRRRQPPAVRSRSDTQEARPPQQLPHYNKRGSDVTGQKMRGHVPLATIVHRRIGQRGAVGVFIDYSTVPFRLSCSFTDVAPGRYTPRWHLTAERLKMTLKLASEVSGQAQTAQAPQLDEAQQEKTIEATQNAHHWVSGSVFELPAAGNVIVRLASKNVVKMEGKLICNAVQLIPQPLPVEPGTPNSVHGGQEQ